MKLFWRKNNKQKETSSPKKPTERMSLGKRGEDAALEYLLELGYILRERNWRHGHSEIDLIMKDERCIVFCEVRSQREEKLNYLTPADSITNKKRASLSQGASYYMARYSETAAVYFKTNPPCRFDVVEVIFKGDEVSYINHIKDAFYRTKKKGKGYKSWKK